MSMVLFDSPGPKARIRNRIYAVIGVLAIAGLLAFVIIQFANAGQFDGKMWEWIEYSKVQEDLLAALVNTLRAFAAGAVLALAFGAIFAAGRLSDHAIFRVPSTIIVEFFRAVPLVVMIFFFHYGLSLGAPFYSVVLGLTLYNGSVLAEVFRAGVLSLPKGQSEAAYAVGMHKTQTMRLVLLPQALRAMLPAIISQLVVLLKDTALGFLITYEELLRYARYLGGIAEFGRPLVPITIVVAAMYIIMCLALTALAKYLESRNRRSKKSAPGTVPPPTDLPLPETTPEPVGPTGGGRGG
ncbi:amino acid ABC transporter permease [Prauserella marina]|uniref:Glutamate transport system permease protein n=1 Tax=Prauserella marina TaxID=530584 RepID=A0A222VUB6_9PSEU|nr:amino acid ABC transporter permease [Prauserella marina]ASR37508.1 amino acid ABC transporter permease [Prauserella marina]PWV75396.1 amino acid ABC transporter membrane protein 2 (PAAT family) [Prauserella marina]SDD35545.1 glutamate transport system permease protein [Prauserella marina]